MSWNQVSELCISDRIKFNFVYPPPNTYTHTHTYAHQLLPVDFSFSITLYHHHLQVVFLLVVGQALPSKALVWDWAKVELEWDCL